MNLISCLMTPLILLMTQAHETPGADFRNTALCDLKAIVVSAPAFEKRYQALEEYSRRAPQQDSISILTAALGDQNPEVRGLAARKLGKIGPAASSAVPALLSKLRDDAKRTRWISNHFARERAVRFDAAEALGLIGKTSYPTIPALARLSTEDSVPEVRVSAALAILRIDSSNGAAWKVLIAALKDDERGTGGPLAAAEALEQLGPLATSAFSELVDQTRHSDEYVRVAAVRAMAAVGRHAAIKPLCETLRDQEPMVRETALVALGNLSASAANAVPDIIMTLTQDGPYTEQVREAAAKALGQIGPAASAAIPHLEALAKASEESQLRTIAVKSLQQIRQNKVPRRHAP